MDVYKINIISVTIKTRTFNDKKKQTRITYILTEQINEIRT